MTELHTRDARFDTQDCKGKQIYLGNLSTPSLHKNDSFNCILAMPLFLIYDVAME